ncbi:hypothetical protein HU200_065502 [Digitaria exilis]|uniref:Crossover junction endonuclease MUS81 n=1 Tax=Digitaria exilis TaxID=1010633 RepID=A0A834ZYI0_9POAL|nr:hypothetical protein HU200_065502 [Digitaria exilis]
MRPPGPKQPKPKTPPVPKQLKVHHPDNEALSRFFLEKWRALMQGPDALSENNCHTFATANRNLCAAKEPIRTLQDFSKIKGAHFANRNWGLILVLFFLESWELSGKKTKGPKCYLPRKNSAAYAILITLHRYCLTKEGEKTARDCISRSGLDDPAGPLLTSAHSASSSANQVQTNSYRDEGIIRCDSDSEEEPCEKSIPLKGKEPTTYSASICPLSSQRVFELQSLSAADTAFADEPILAMPPRQPNEKFLEAYEVVFILDDREKFGSRSRKVADNIRSQIHVPVEVRHLPVGDAIWIARNRKDRTEYVLDFIVERKEVLDLNGSIEDNRYRDQKLRMKRCGLRKMIYLVEGDPNNPDVRERTKTACFTTEILDGFDVQRTSGFADTQRRYCHLTRSIIECYDANVSTLAETRRVCPTYDEFKRKCELEKTTVSQIFALQLMQVPQVTEEAALAVIRLYPTPFFLAQAYYALDGDPPAQQAMLESKNKKINAGASRNVFELFCGDGRNTQN